MKIMFIGDIVGRVGREMVKEHVKRLRKEHQLDYVIANGENAAHGKGITSRIYRELLSYGVDFITLGNHAFSKSEVKLEFNQLIQMIRPENLKDAFVGTGHKSVSINGQKVGIINLLGKGFMDVCTESPFEVMDRILEAMPCDLYIVDLHAETTAEKLAFAFRYQDQIQICVGTHTHVQTADQRIIGKTAYITDVGMCGAYHSILGRDVDEVISRFVDDAKTRFTVAEGAGCFSAVIAEIDETAKKAIAVERVLLLP